MRLKKWTKEEEQRLKENAYMPMRELVAIMPGRNRKTIYWKLGELGINRQTYKRYDKNEDDYIINNYDKKGNREIAKFLNRTEKSVAKRMIVLGLNRDSEILKKLAKNNKGCFKKGSTNSLAYLNGTLHLAYDERYNYYYYRIKYNGKMIRYSRYLYEVFHNVKLKTTDVIIHKDGNPLNIMIDNLELVDRKQNLDRNINSDNAFIKRILRVSDEETIEMIKKEAMPVVELKRAQIKLNQKLKETCKTS